MRLRMDDDDDDAVNSHARARGKSTNVSRTRSLRVLNHMFFSAYFCMQKPAKLAIVKANFRHYLQFSSMNIFTAFFSHLWLKARDTFNWVRARSTLCDIHPL